MEREPYGKLYRVRTGKESAQPLRLPGQEMAADGNESYNIYRVVPERVGPVHAK